MSATINVDLSISAYNTNSALSPGTGFSSQSTYQQTGSYAIQGSLLVPAGISALVAGATNANPIQITTVANHNLVQGDVVTIAGVLGNTAANGVWVATVVSPTSFTIPANGTGGQSYLSGGTVTTPAGCAIPLGQVTEPHWACFANLDPANYVQILTAQSGTPFLYYAATEMTVVNLPPTLLTLWALANTSSVYLQYAIWQM